MSRSAPVADPDLQTVSALFAHARRILFITGAGLSADSGLPTYRGIGGLYDERLTGDGLSIEEALSGRMLVQRPDLTWKYIAEIEANCRGAQPNAAHRLIAELERHKERVCVLTQNVDGLHRLAGSHDVIEIHGTLHRLSCLECPHARTVSDYAGLSLPPACPQCGGPMRPDVVLFGEELPASAVGRLEEVLASGVDLVVSIGTSSVFPYIAGPVLWAGHAGIPTVEINPGDTCVSARVRHHLRLGAAEALTRIMHMLPQIRRPAH